MKKILVLLFLIPIFLKSFSQVAPTKIFYNGIDSFFIGDKKEKFIDSTVKNRFKFIQANVIQNHFITHYSYNYDSLVAFSIDTISFRNMIFTFNNEDLATIDLSLIYKIENYTNPINYAKSAMGFLREYITTQLQKKGKTKDFGSYKTSKNYGYQWKNADNVIFLNIQYDSHLTKYVFLNLYISNTKLEAQY